MLSPMKIGLKIELINDFLSTKIDSFIIIFFENHQYNTKNIYITT
ncbi:hypothetical protein DJ66_0345 [Candidatus Liberibacter solanacearum]|uniref:Uncharacterized protein n=1 Tax=Candidatus Liberibacter solanacearum TaxID=556287 RepID=A0A0F4VJG3_9HYPH|nr:hypothetical protein DJ66_0345 [Candidatus Liberibacter solanacearum]